MALLGLALGGGAAAYDRLVPRELARAADGPSAGPAERPEAPRRRALAPTDAGAGFLGLVAARAFFSTGAVDDVLVGGPAWKAGLRPGDVVLAIDGAPTPIPSIDPTNPRRRWTLVWGTAVAIGAGAWDAFGGARGTEVVLRVRKKGEVVVPRALTRPALAAAWRKQRAAEAHARTAKLEQELRRLEPKAAAARRALAAPPGWAAKAFRAHAAAAREPLRALAAREPDRPALDAALAACARGSHAGLVAAMAKLPDHFDLAIMHQDCCAGLPIDLRGAYRLAALLEAHRLAKRGDLAAAMRLAERAETGRVADEEETSFSGDDPRTTAAAAKARMALVTLIALTDRRETARKDLAEARRAEADARTARDGEPGAV